MIKSEPSATDALITVLSVLLSLFVLSEVNYPFLTPQSQLAVFGGLGLVLVYLNSGKHGPLDALGAVGVAVSFGFVLIQNESTFESLWIDGRALGERAGQEAPFDYLIGLVALLVVLEATRRTIGNTLPILALVFIAYAAWGPHVPGWLFPHRGYGWDRIVSQTILQSQGVFGIAMRVMLTYVFLFVLFGSVLEKTGATDFIIAFATRLFKSKQGAPAKVAVISSGLMGSLSGSAVANTATTGTFTIPLMRSAGFKPEQAAGIEAAASSGGALVPPIMGAGAYMMLEIVDPPVTYLQIITAAIIPVDRASRGCRQEGFTESHTGCRAVQTGRLSVRYGLCLIDPASLHRIHTLPICIPELADRGHSGSAPPNDPYRARRSRRYHKKDSERWCHAHCRRGLRRYRHRCRDTHRNRVAFAGCARTARAKQPGSGTHTIDGFYNHPGDGPSVSRLLSPNGNTRRPHTR
jgi:hypothetical protein